MIHVLQLLFAGVLIASFSYALLGGGWPERTGAMIAILASVLTIIAQGTMMPAWHGISTPVLIIDALVVVAFTNLALLSDRYWPIWAASFQIPIIAIDLAPFFLGRVPPKVLSQAEPFWAYPTLLAIMIGTWSYRRNRRRSDVTSS